MRAARLASFFEAAVARKERFEHGRDQHRHGCFFLVRLFINLRVIRTLCDCLTICTPNDVFSACEGARRRPSQPFPQGLPEDNG